MAETIKKQDSASLKKLKEEVRIRNDKILTEDKKKRLKDAGLMK